jgi:hypothetical protein
MMFLDDHIRITHPSRHTARVDVPCRRSWFKAKARALTMLRGKLWAAPGGPAQIPMHDVRTYDFGDRDQEYWSTPVGWRDFDDRMAAALERGLRAARRG